MNKRSGFVISLLVLLIAGILVVGCTDSSSANTPSAQTPAITTTPSNTPLYIAGDIVRSSKGAAETGWLILKYDSGSDSYERAFIYRNTDASWGYRVDSRTESVGRSVLEKVNTVKVTHVDVSRVPLTQPTVTISPVTATATRSGTITAITTTVTTTTLAMKPRVVDITPDTGKVGTSVVVSDLQGNGFQSGATVMLARSSSPNIIATHVSVLSLSHISCTLVLPTDATIGYWDIIVVNPDGQSVQYNAVFLVLVNANPSATTTTSSTGGIGITSIDPTFTPASGTYLPIAVSGSNFKNGITCKLTQNGKADISASEAPLSSDTQMRCFFSIPAGSQGAWNLVLSNTDGTLGTLTNGFSVNG
ncbi:MAG: hypothetical protein WC620_09475 [Methanoregula sp.]|jgi:hypothetical protein